MVVTWRPRGSTSGKYRSAKGRLMTAMGGPSRSTVSTTRPSPNCFLVNELPHIQIMIKPALPYLDIIYRIREEIELPLAAYNVSGEFSMIKAAEKMGWLDGPKVMMETLTAIKRAGADLILTYFALEAAQALMDA